jgi:hypothetical protein
MKPQGPHLVDEYGRRLILRGVNLGGSSKVPSNPDGATYLRNSFFDHRHVSFVGRPFPLEEADEHFTRLRRWGLTFLRLLVSWEAVEHEGPGCYDQVYLDYLYALVRKAGEHGLQLVIDPHQDVWGRLSGGDGAPGWTYEAAGFDPARFDLTGAAITHAVHGDPFPRMIWPTNGSKLAAATMFTLFFGGNDFAPATRVAEEPVQEYLQRHYLAAIRQVARRLSGLPAVVGYDTLNEPMPGYIGWPDLGRFHGPLRLGDTPSPYQSMLLGDGFPQQVDYYRIFPTGARRAGSHPVNAERHRAWLPGRQCVWRENGVWDIGPDGQPRLLRPQHFAQVDGHPVHFNDDYYRPFANRFAREIRTVDPESLIFLEGEPGVPGLRWRLQDAPRVVYAPHWYDGLVLLFKDFNPLMGLDYRIRRLVLGFGPIRRSFASQVEDYLKRAGEEMGGIPTLIGEFGIPFDMQDKRAYRTGDFSHQVRALDRSFKAMEDNRVGCVVWNYTANNTNARGDQWNDEDLSIFSRDQVDGAAGLGAGRRALDAGGRALEALFRPYAARVAGDPLHMSFDLRTRRFEFTFRHEPRVAAPTEIFVPDLQYPPRPPAAGYRVQVSDGETERRPEEQLLLYRHTPEQAVHTVRIWPG